MWSFFSRDPSRDFPYEVGEVVPGLEDKSIWKQHKGKKKGSGEDVSIFTFDVKAGSETQLEIAKAALKRLKTLRHPSILTYLDSLETDKVIYLATECVEPLESHLKQLTAEGHQREMYLAWGLFQVTRGLSFLNNDAHLSHNNVCFSSVFVNTAGEWKLGGLEYVGAAGEGSIPIKILPVLEKYDPPEKSDPGKQRLMSKSSTDMWGLGCLIWEIFNGPLPRPASLKSLTNIPKSLSQLYCELVGANPSSRPNPSDIVSRGCQPGGCFCNDLVKSLLFLEEIQIKDTAEKGKFFSGLTDQLDDFPENVAKHRILSQLVNAFEFGDAGSAVLAPMFKLGNLLSEDEYQKKIVPCVVKLFSSNDRNTRVRLLQQLEHFVGHLQPTTINDQIFPQIAMGFLDTNPTIREYTVKAMIHLAPKLNYNNLNVEMLKHFARLQSKDDQAGIRTNTTVCLGKISVHLHPQMRQKVLISAFIRAMRDPFPPARCAGVQALAATQHCYLLSELSARILPALCQLTVDPEKIVRDAVFRTLKGFFGKLEKVSEDPSLKEEMEADVHAATPNLSNSTASWAGWAVTAVTSKFYRSQLGPGTPVKSEAKPTMPEKASSSSAPSTATSSVVSTPTTDREGQLRSKDGNKSDSDYEDNWDQGASWGSMEMQSASKAASQVVPTLTDEGTGAVDGWEVEDWGSIDDTTPALMPLNNTANPQASFGWEAEFTPVDDRTSKLMSSYNWGGDSSTDAFAAFSVQPKMSHSVSENFASLQKSNSGWDEGNWESMEDSSGSGQADEARRKREERKLQRQKELETKRAMRQTSGGPLKLGAKRL